MAKLNELERAILGKYLSHAEFVLAMPKRPALFFLRTSDATRTFGWSTPGGLKGSSQRFRSLHSEANMDLRRIEERLAIVLRNAEGWLPAEQLGEMQSLVRAGEPGVALENFCTQLEEYDVVVPDDVASELRALAGLMRMKIPRWIERGGHA